MPIRLAILGLDPVQHEWLDAVDALREAGEVELVGVGHRSLSLARDVAENFATDRPAAFDDLRLLLKDTAPQVILMDRPSNVGIDFILACATQEIGILSLGPPVENVAEAQELAGALEARTHLLYVWPRLADSFAYRQCMQGEVTLHPIKFASATWLGMNHALAKTAGVNADIAVRSLSVLAWDVLATLIELFELPTTVYASIRGTVGSGDLFSDISGACSLTLRFPGDGVASVTLCDRIPGPSRREMLLLGQNGQVKLQPGSYEFQDVEGKLVDSGSASATLQQTGKAAGAVAIDTLREFLEHFSQPSSPSRGWTHRLQDVAATMEALVVSHRTGQAESPEKFRRLRR
jgi:predicted dehydrogenase